MRSTFRPVLRAATGLVAMSACSSLTLEVSADQALVDGAADIIYTIEYPDEDLHAAGLREVDCIDAGNGVCVISTTASAQDGPWAAVTVWLDLDGEDWDEADGDPKLVAPSLADPTQSFRVDLPVAGVIRESVHFSVEAEGQ